MQNATSTLPPLPAPSEHADLITAAERTIYHYLLKEEQINSQPIIKDKREKKSYDDLCILRRNLSEKYEIPNPWILNERGCPKIKIEYNSVGRLKYDMQWLKGSDYPLKNAVLGILEIIAKFFKLLLQLNAAFIKWNVYRNDSFEVMFFGDLAIWLSVSLPRYDIKNVDTPILINNWIKYCDAVEGKVLFYRNDENSPNSAKKLLGIIIEELKTMQMHVQKHLQAISFNESIKNINLSIINMAKDVFNLQYFLIADASPHCIKYYDGINIIYLLKHHQAHPHIKADPKLKKITKTLLGAWLKETLTLAGIESSDFINTQKINIQSISEYLSTDFSQIKDMNAFGLWAIEQKDRMNAEKYMLDIAQIYRCLLMVYYVRENILIHVPVYHHYGDSWDYESPQIQKFMQETLFTVISHSISALKNAISHFWEVFHHQDYAPKNRTKDNTDIVYANLCKADSFVRKIEEHGAEIKNKIIRINFKYQDHRYFDQDKIDEIVHESLEQKMKVLKSYIQTYAQYHHLNLNLGYRERQPDNHPIIIKQFQYLSSNEKDKLIALSVAECPLYLQAQALYQSFQKQKLEKMYLSQTLKESELHSDIQKNIYFLLLKPYYSTVKNSNIISIFSDLPREKIDEFRQLYFFISHVMSLFYASNQRLRTNFSQMDIELVDVMLLNTIRTYLKEINLKLPIYFQAPPFEVVYEANTKSVIVNNRNDWKALIGKVEHSPLPNSNELSMAHRHQLAKAHQRFNEILSQLKIKTDELTAKSIDKSYIKVSRAAEKLILTLEQEEKYLFSTLKMPTQEALTVFQNNCQAAICEAKIEFAKHRQFWGQLNPIIKQLLGVLALITIIPAVLVSTYAKHGFVGTFFHQKPSDSSEKLADFERKFNTYNEKLHSL